VDCARSVDLLSEYVQHELSGTFAGQLSQFAEESDEFWVLDPDRHKGPLIAGTTN
jgi:hypothetical protein